jgi:hypothetical protein
MKQLDLFKKINDENLIEYLLSLGYSEPNGLLCEYGLLIDDMLSDFNNDVEKLLKYLKCMLKMFQRRRDEFYHLEETLAFGSLSDDFYITLFEYDRNHLLMNDSLKSIEAFINNLILDVNGGIKLLLDVINFININK